MMTNSIDRADGGGQEFFLTTITQLTRLEFGLLFPTNSTK